MKYVKNFTKKLAMLFLALSLAIPAVSVSMPATEAQAADSVTLSYKLGISKKATDAQAKALHEALMTGKKITLVYTDSAYAEAHLANLQIKIASDYSYGTKFKYVRRYGGVESPNDWKFVISAKNAAAYAAEVSSLSSVVSTASDELAQEIHDALIAKKAYSFSVTKKSVVKKLAEKAGNINGQDVIFQYTIKKVPSKNCYRVTISQAQAKAYYWSIKLSAKILKYAQEYPYDYEGMGAEFDTTKADAAIAAASCMADLSDIVKVYAVEKTGMLYYNGNEHGLGIKSVTAANRTTYTSTAALLKDLYSGNAKTGNVNAALAVYAMWGIDVEVSRGIEGAAANSDGVTVYFEEFFDDMYVGLEQDRYENLVKDENDYGDYVY